ncbi:MAG: hypothetical protein TRG1_3509 [Flavobacteriaceae bacterium FS1-H7996/R]|nr:MAG: hypothetical protein TRG1_3509 [Flavobacteriaceae bacterium FS1-H7996/R]
MIGLFTADELYQGRWKVIIYFIHIRFVHTLYLINRLNQTKPGPKVDQAKEQTHITSKRDRFGFLVFGQ